MYSKHPRPSFVLELIRGKQPKPALFGRLRSQGTDLSQTRASRRLPTACSPPSSEYLFLSLGRSNSISRTNISVGVINWEVGAHKLLLPSLVSQVPPDSVPVLLSLQRRDQVDTSPHLLAGELILLPDTLSELVPAICHHQAHAKEELGRAEAARGQVALRIWKTAS